MKSISMSKQQKFKAGLTLIELVVVVGIVTLLSAITLPTLRTVMNQRKSSQASILVKNMFEAARARAIARGRPVAVVLERLSSRATRDATGAVISENASTTDLAGNYALYNTTVRLSLAETPPPIVVDGVALTWNTIENPVGSGNFQLFADVTLSSLDVRLAQLMKVGVEVEFPEVVSLSRRMLVEDLTGAGLTYRLSLNVPFQVQNNNAITPLQAAQAFKQKVDSTIASRRAVFGPANLNNAASTRMLIHSIPQPVAAQVVDLPKGTCIDLSLSGYASPIRWGVPMAAIQNRINQRDTRRQFASDWAYTIDFLSATNTTTNVEPLPEYLRPVYVVFGASGAVESVFSNGYSGLVGSTLLNRYDTHEDLYFFVGKTDQIVRVNGTPTTTDGFSLFPEVLEAERIKANINDASGSWIRVSPSSGAISVASAVSVYDTPFPDGTLPTAASFPTIGDVLYRSRLLSFTDEATAQ